MKSIRTVAALLASLLLVSQTAFAEQPDENFTTFGHSDCGQWINQNNDVRKFWLMGFLSGMNAGSYYAVTGALKTPFRNPLGRLNSAEQAYAWMDNYCKAHPLRTVTEGAIGLWVELGNK